MSTQQDICAAGSESRPPMLNKENYVPWSSRLLCYLKSRPNGKLIHNFIINGPYVRRMIPEPGDINREVLVNKTFHMQTDDELTEKELKQIEVDDQAIQTILLGLPEDIYAAVDSCEMAQEIWLRVQQMMKGSDIGIQEKKARLFNEWEMFTSNKGESIESYYHRFLKLMNDSKRNKHFPKKTASNLKFLNNLQPEWSQNVTIVHQTKDLHTADYTQLYDFLKYNQKEVDELKAERLAKTQDPLALMANSNNLYVFPAPHQDQPSFNQNYMQQPMPNPEDIIDPTTAINMALALMAKAFKLNYSTTNNNQRISSNPRNRQIAQPEMNMGQDRQMQIVGGIRLSRMQFKTQELRILEIRIARAEGNAVGQNGNPIRRKRQESNSKLKSLIYDLDGSAEVHDYENCNDNEIFHMFTQEEQYTELLEPIPDQHQESQNDNNVISKEAAKFVRDFKSLANEVDASLAKHKALKLEIERLLKAIKLKSKNVELEFQILNYARENAHLKATYKNLFDSIFVSRTQTKTIIASLQNELQSAIYKDAKLRTQLFKKVSDQKDNTHDTSANTKFAKQPIVENLTMVVETHALSNPVTSNSVSTPQEPKVVKMIRSSSKNNKVPYVVKSSYKKNKEVDVEENHRNLLSSSNKKHVSSNYNDVKLATENVYSKVVCAMCKQCLISVNHDVCLLNHVNCKNSHGKKQNAYVFNVANQKKHKAQVWKPKNVGSKERLASPKPRSPRFCLRWSPTRRFFDLKGKIITSSESKSQSDCSSGDNAFSSNPLEPISKRFPNSTFSMTGQNWFDTLLIPLLFEYKPMDKGDHEDNECVTY
nr:hypothetical protein [Tanacetum cinerariifolium]